MYVGGRGGESGKGKGGGGVESKLFCDTNFYDLTWGHVLHFAMHWIGGIQVLGKQKLRRKDNIAQQTIHPHN